MNELDLTSEMMVPPSKLFLVVYLEGTLPKNGRDVAKNKKPGTEVPGFPFKRSPRGMTHT